MGVLDLVPIGIGLVALYWAYNGYYHHPLVLRIKALEKKREGDLYALAIMRELLVLSEVRGYIDKTYRVAGAGMYDIIEDRMVRWSAREEELRGNLHSIAPSWDKEIKYAMECQKEGEWTRLNSVTSLARTIGTLYGNARYQFEETVSLREQGYFDPETLEEEAEERT